MCIYISNIRNIFMRNKDKNDEINHYHLYGGYISPRYSDTITCGGIPWGFAHITPVPLEFNDDYDIRWVGILHVSIGVVKE